MTDQAAIFGMLILYKICVLLVGLLFAWMGFRLFLADKVAAAGDFSASNSSYAISLKGGAPGVFFCLFGTILICISVFKGVEAREGGLVTEQGGSVRQVIPNRPPV